MFPTTRNAALVAVTILSVFSSVVADTVSSKSPTAHQNAAKACRELQRRLPHVVHFPGSPEYLQDIKHYEQVSAQNSTCGVAPKTVEDVQETIKIIGRRDIRSPFAIKSGGHAFNPTFSSTPGVQISLHNLLDFHYDHSAQTVRLGSGWTWDQVYEKLQPENVTVVGGRIPGVGLGLLYGGGLSWYTNQHGLASDNAISFSLVLPNGTFVEVTQDTQPDLFFGLRGGGSNFGIITGVTVKAWPTGGIWGGKISYDFKYNEEIMKAVEVFSVENTDVKAQLQAVYTVTNNQTFWQILFFYDAPDARPAPFEALLSIPSTEDTTKITTHSQFVTDSPFPPGIGSFLHTIPIIHYTVPILRAVQSSVDKAHAKSLASNKSVQTLYWFAEPFVGHYTHTGTSPSAWPHSASNPTTPSCFWFDYTRPGDEGYFRKLIQEAGREVQETVVREGEGRWEDVKFPNYAVDGVGVEEVYGESLGRMRVVKRRVDREGVLGLLSGGFLV